MIDGVREVPIQSLAPGRRFELVLTATTPAPHKRLLGTLVRKGPGTVAVVLDNAERERSFTTAEGAVVTLHQAGSIVYWSPGTPVIPKFQADGKTPAMRDISRWTTKGGTGVGEDLHHPDNYNLPQLDSARLGEKASSDMGSKERTVALPGTGGHSKAAKKKAAAKAKTPKELHPCLCGCGERVAGRFRQGHDGRYYSILKKVAAAEMQFSEMPKAMQAALGSTAGVKKALKDSKH